MKALVLEGPGRLGLVERAVPVPGVGESLVRVSAVGLCGSDLHWFGEGGIGDAQLGRPLVLGHEFGGTVQGGPLDGRRVAVDPAIPCRTCARCQEGNHNLCPTVRFAGHGRTDGGLQEYVAWPTALLHPVPDNFSDATIALLEPLGVALHAFDLGHVGLAASVAVVGCGPIGLMLVEVARAASVATVVAVEPLAHRREAARARGADVVLSPADVGGYQGEVDVAFDGAGQDDAVAATIRLARPGGRVVLAGIPDDDITRFPAGTARRKGLTIVLVRRMKEAYPRAIGLVERKVLDLSPLVSRSFSLDEGAAAFTYAASRAGLKTVVSVHDGG